jgi:hypothetical protein
MATTSQIPEHLAHRIEMMAMSPTPSCQALKSALVEGLALPVPSLSMHDEAYTHSVLGKVVKAWNFVDVPLCHSCLDADVWPGDGMPIRTFWYWSSTGEVHAWQVSTAVRCDYCPGARGSQEGTPGTGVK